MALKAIEHEIDAHLERVESAEDWQERIDGRAAEFRKDTKKIREAESWVSGTLSGDYYTQVSLALYALHRLGLTPGVTRALEGLAKVQARAIDGELSKMAEASLREEEERIATDAAEARMERAA
ncbi:hypothetical protein [Pseudoxanthomonas sp. X-1]|uniref:hypothetical protein n=1 Tax=Pseudoxanthomonas sp. X-1 TaxID=2571115 RepID=UPI00110B2A1B|nr:hypothetical protein [Pseudoxanthomonas sp. X-1]TMN18494.1 hypothetical protein FF950_14535 [Pseudoxanthomonas sp. X-1]UAY76002.1 hypothetical protein LAJ50_07130 [Pseudoxanthomonas sp. X-1]